MFENELSTSEDTQESSGQSTPESSSEQPEQGTPSQEVLDLDSVQKFKFAGREWTPKDFQGAYMMHADYSRKTQEIAKERRYYENLGADLEAVQKDPKLIDKFRSIYPKSFHSYLRYVQSQQTPTQTQTSGDTNPVDNTFKERFEKLESEIHDRKVQAYSDELEAKSKQLSEKYPMADEEAVLARAQVLIDRGDKLTDKVWDSLWKAVNDKNQVRFDQTYSKKVKEQKTTNFKAKDVASGGGTPSPAPRQARTIKEATKMLLDSENL